jgi:hypothetical protein
MFQLTVPRKEIKEAAEGNGLAWATVRRAKDRLGAKAQRQSEGQSGAGRWVWSLQGAQNGARCSNYNVSALQENEHLAEPTRAPDLPSSSPLNSLAACLSSSVSKR